MLILKRFTVEGVSPFHKKQTFEFRTGITVVYGLNKVTTASKNGNGSGKTRLLKTIPGVFFQNPLTGTPADRVKTGVRTIEAEVHGKDYTFVKSGSKLKILDAKNKAVGRGTTETKAWLAKNLPLNEDTFAAVTYIDSLKHHPLVKGTTPERKAFLNEFFELDKIDRERKLIDAAVKKYAPVVDRAIQLEEMLAKLTKSLEDKPSLKELKEKFEKSTEKLTRLQEKASHAMEVRRLVEFMRDNKRLIRELDRALNGEELTEESFAKLMKNTREDLRENLEKLELARGWEEYKRRNAAYEEALEELPKAARRALKEGTAEKCATHYRKYLEAKEAVEGMAKLKKPVKPETVEEPTSDLAQCVAKLTRLEIQLEHAEELHTGTCPTCGQDVQAVDADDLRGKLRYLRKEVQAWDAWKAYRKERAEWKVDRSEYLEKVAQREHWEKRMAAYEDGFQTHKVLRDLPAAPEPWTGKRYPVKEYEVMAEQDRARLQTLKFLETNIHTIIEFRSRKDTDYDDEIINRVSELADKHARIGAQLEIVRETRRQIKEHREQADALEEDRALLMKLKKIQQGYADKGIKKMAIQSISSLLMVQVNRFAARVMPENFQFELNWDNTQLDIVVHRKYGKRVESSDVRDLSGAESRLFTYVMVLALMTFIPEKRRSNVLVLDEPTANMSEEIIESFKTLLEVMATVIPSIVVVTPNAWETYDGAHCVTVVKKNGRSMIVDGHPSTIKG